MIYKYISNYVYPIFIYSYLWSDILLKPRLKSLKSKLQETCQKRKLKALKNTLKPLKYCYFFFDSQLTVLIQNKTKTKYCNNQWNYFQRGCMDKWRSADFLIQTWCIPLEATVCYFEVFFFQIENVSSPTQRLEVNQMDVNFFFDFPLIFSIISMDESKKVLSVYM